MLLTQIVIKLRQQNVESKYNTLNLSGRRVCVGIVRFLERVLKRIGNRPVIFHTYCVSILSSGVDEKGIEKACSCLICCFYFICQFTVSISLYLFETADNAMDKFSLRKVRL